VPEHRNRGFWLVVGGVGLASVLLVAAILYNAPMKETIGHAARLGYNMLSISGGEPLLYPGLRAICQEGRRQCGIPHRNCA